MTSSEELFKQAHARAAREIAELELALWAAVNGREVLASRDDLDDAFRAQMAEAVALGETICRVRTSWVEKMPMDDFVGRLREVEL